MNFSIEIKISVLLTNKTHLYFESHQKKVIPDKLHKVTDALFLLIFGCMESQEHLIIVSVACMWAAIEWLLGEQLEALWDRCFCYSSIHIQHLIFFLVPARTLLWWLLVRPAGDAWPLRAIEFIQIILILAIKKQTEVLFCCDKQRLTNAAIFTFLPLSLCRTKMDKQRMCQLWAGLWNNNGYRVYLNTISMTSWCTAAVQGSPGLSVASQVSWFIINSSNALKHT